MAELADVDEWFEDEVYRRVDGPEPLQGRAERLVGDFYQGDDGELRYEPHAPSHLVGQANHRLAAVEGRRDDGDLDDGEYQRELLLEGAVLGYEVAKAAQLAGGIDNPVDIPAVQTRIAGYIDEATAAVYEGFARPPEDFSQGMQQAAITIDPERTRSEEDRDELRRLIPE
ncbi:MAG: hypothetical protein SVY41_03240 [Candidatus Nanohaloarchaea archaeon]|nr:hypothetical protein [Candidatus Nanohaloarchaea archaeon]